MPEIVLPGPTIIIMLAVLLVIFVIIMAIYEIKIGRIVCNFVGQSLVHAFGYTGVFIGLTDIGVQAVCNPLPF